MLEEIKQLLLQLRTMLEDLSAKIKISAQQITVNTLSDISKTLGLVQAGEFRVGNSKEPGSGFTGVRMAYPPIVVGNDSYPFGSWNTDVLQVGISLEDGKLYGGEGDVIIDSSGISIMVGTGLTNKIKFWDGTTTFAHILCDNQSPKKSLQLSVSDVNYTEILLTATNSVTAGISQLDLNTIDSGLKSTGTIYVGDFAGATGKINKVQISANVVATPVTFSADTLNNRIGIRTTTPQDALHINGNVIIGYGTAATDYTLTFDGETNDGIITWMEDEDYFAFDKGIKIAGNVSATTFAVGATAGINATVSYTDTILGAKTLTFTKGILTAQV